ncbi:MAG TPA: GNAT family N-acetyltransferase [Symbiobacteriaceae bacterium]|nr:GNAT family N-acetyltransferase [Symbiobacteriaceae bacterium]
MAYAVRRATAADQAQLTELIYLYIVDFYKRPRPAEAALHGLMARLDAGEIGLQFVAEEDGRLVGFATLYWTWSTLRCQPATIMNDLYVVEDRRGSGVAEALFRACEGYTRENGYAYMAWETDPDNVRAQRFYEKMGGRRGETLHYWI